MSTREMLDAILSSNSSDAMDMVTTELGERSNQIKSDYKKAAIADYFGGVVVEEEKKDKELDKEADGQEEGKGKKDSFKKKDKDTDTDDEEDSDEEDSDKD